MRPSQKKMMTDEQTSLMDLGSNIEPPKTPRAKAKTAAQGLPATRRIILEENDNIPPTGLFVGHNGKGYLIRPGEAVDLPVDVLKILDNAIMSKPITTPEGSVVGYRDQSKYPYRLVEA